MTEREAALIGKIIASMTHEMKNVLAVIKESGGLVGDVASLPPEKGLKFFDKLGSAVAKIEKHMARGVEIQNRLNAFAHGMDEPKGKVWLNETAEQAAFLMGRLARQKQAELKAETLGRDRQAETCPVRFFLAVIALVDACLASASQGDVLTVRAWAKGDKGGVEVATSAGSAWTSDADVPEDALADAGASLEPTEGGMGLALSV